MSPKHRGARRAILLYSLAPTGIEARTGFNLNSRRRTAVFWIWFTRQRRAENPVIAFAFFCVFRVLRGLCFRFVLLRRSVVEKVFDKKSGSDTIHLRKKVPK